MKPGTPRLLPTLGLIAASGLAAAPVLAAGYKTAGLCEGFPKVQVKAPAGYCVGLVADERQGLKSPRRMLQVAPGRFWLVDMGGWDAGRGRLLELAIAPGAVKVTVLASKLDRPHGLALGPDGKAYIGEATRIWRTSTTKFAPETVISGLPGDGAQPLKELAFGSGGRLYINVGAFSDRCQNDAKKLPLPSLKSLARSRVRRCIKPCSLARTGIWPRSSPLPPACAIR